MCKFPEIKMKMDNFLDKSWESLMNLLKPEAARMIEDKIYESLVDSYLDGKPLKSPKKILEEVIESQPDGNIFKEDMLDTLFHTPFRNIAGFNICMN